MPHRGSELYDFAAIKKHETDKAILLNDGTKDVWLPKSQVQDNGDGTFTIPAWLAEEKELV